MPRKRYSPEQIIGKLREAEVLLSQGHTVSSACWALGQPRSSQRYVRRRSDDEAPLTERIVALANQYGRHGYRRITAKLRHEGWRVNHKRVERIWRREGRYPLRAPAHYRQPTFRWGRPGVRSDLS